MSCLKSLPLPESVSWRDLKCFALSSPLIPVDSRVPRMACLSLEGGPTGPPLGPPLGPGYFYWLEHFSLPFPTPTRCTNRGGSTVDTGLSLQRSHCVLRTAIPLWRHDFYAQPQTDGDPPQTPGGLGLFPSSKGQPFEAPSRVQKVPFKLPTWHRPGVSFPAPRSTVTSMPGPGGLYPGVPPSPLPLPLFQHLPLSTTQASVPLLS